MSGRVKLALFIVLMYVGIGLLPYVGLPYARFDWQVYSAAYVPTPYRVRLPLILRNAS